MHLFASCRLQHASQKNLFSARSASEDENLRMHALTDEFCSISSERSRKHSSRLVTVSHVRQRVSLVRMPSKMEWIHVLGLYGAGALGSSLADASLPARPAPWPVAFFSRFSSSSAHSFSR